VHCFDPEEEAAACSEKFISIQSYFRRMECFIIPTVSISELSGNTDFFFTFEGSWFKVVRGNFVSLGVCIADIYNSGYNIP
jgi:hypothetical protein